MPVAGWAALAPLRLDGEVTVKQRRLRGANGEGTQVDRRHGVLSVWLMLAAPSGRFINQWQGARFTQTYNNGCTVGDFPRRSSGGTSSEVNYARIYSAMGTAQWLRPAAAAMANQHPLQIHGQSDPHRS